MLHNNKHKHVFYYPKKTHSILKLDSGLNFRFMGLGNSYHNQINSLNNTNDFQIQLNFESNQSVFEFDKPSSNFNRTEFHNDEVSSSFFLKFNNFGEDNLCA